jgi:hypothetical protein
MATRKQILAAMHTEFDGVKKQLADGLERMERLRQQLDAIDRCLQQLLKA